MKVRNKKTGKIGELHFIEDKEYHFTVSPEDPADMCLYKKLADVNEEWEDYEEPDELTELINYVAKGLEEGELGVGCNDLLEELEAWKRLRDAGAEFYGWRRNQTGTYELYMRWEDRIPRSYEVKKDLDLLFGGEE